MEYHLKLIGWETTEVKEEADLIIAHAGQTSGVAKCDVAICHGLYPTAHHPQAKAHWAANANVINNLKNALEIIVPSQWVADIIRRDMCIDPHIVNWGIEPDLFTPPDETGDYILWNKTRSDSVCDPSAFLDLAHRNPSMKFLTTFGKGGANVKAIGRQLYDAMRKIVRESLVYIATTKETFGIGTLEAMACGVPVLGYRHGATASLVEHGVTGYLVEPGDLDGLNEGLHYILKHRDTLSQNAVVRASEYTWQAPMDKMADIFEQALQKKIAVRSEPRVSVVIPCHNYADYIVEAVDSMVKQETLFDYEIIIVYDKCTDDSADRVEAYLQENKPHERVTIRTEHTDYGSPAKARNHGIGIASGDYIVCLDADDRIASVQFLSTLSNALHTNPQTGLVFTGLQTISEIGERLKPATWPDGYDFTKQAKHMNQVPTCNMFRKSAWAHAGGYRQYVEPAEDAELWLRMGALGYDMEQVTKEGWFEYRMHDKSLSAGIRRRERAEPEWRHFHPWTKTDAFPFPAAGVPRGQWSWPVRNYDKPTVSVVIPVGPGHEQHLLNALDSVYGQTYWNWECIVVNDTGQPLSIPSYPWARVISGTYGSPAKARNAGVKYATAPLIAFLDADDMWFNSFLSKTVSAYERTGRYIYTDWISRNKNGGQEPHTCPDYAEGIVFKQTSIHSISIVMPKAWHDRIGGFDESMTTWEDVDYFMKLAKEGLCGQRVSEALIFYDYNTGTVRERGEAIKDNLKQMLYNRYSAYIEGKEKMCCGNEPTVAVKITQSLKGNNETIRIRYQTDLKGRAHVTGAVTKKNYGSRAPGDIFYVFVQDQKAEPDKFIPVADTTSVIQQTPAPPPPQSLAGA